MKKKHLALIFLVSFLTLILLITTIAASTDTSIDFLMNYGGDGTDIAFQGIQTKDKGFALIGTTNSFGNGGFDFWLVKTAENGTVEWNKYYGGTGDDAGSSVLQTSDGGYVLAGYTDSFNFNDFDFLLIKTDNFGEIKWIKNYGGTNEDRATSCIQTVEGGFAIAGFSNSFSSNDDFDFLLVKTDKDGDIEWYKTYGGNNSEQANKIIQTNDNGFLIVGETSSFGAGNYDFWVVKTDLAGSMQWNKTFGGTGIDSAKSAIQTGDGGFLIVGETNSFGAGNYDFWVVKTDINGSMQWNRTFGWKDSDHAQNVVQTNDGGFLIAGYSERLLFYDFQLFKTDTLGYLQWEKNYSVNKDIFCNSIIKTSDDNYLLSGFLVQEYTNMDFFMLKTNVSSFENSKLYPIAFAGLDETVNVSENVYFNASGFDPDGKIVRYRWDFNGDGIFDWESNISDTAIHNFSQEGVYKAYLEVTDNDNLKYIDMRIVIVKSSKEDNELYPKKQDGSFNYLLILGSIFGIIIIISLIFYTFFRKKIKDNLISKKFYNILKNKKWYHYLTLFFFLLLISKLIISMFFNKPYIYSDEFIYSVVANKIFQGNLMIFGAVPFSPTAVPIAYPFVIAPAYIFIDDMNFVYHTFLLINSILTSLVIFPVFFIMRKFVDEKKSLLASIIVGTLPIILSVNFAILSENLFYVLFLISCLLIIKTFSYDKFNKWFILLATFTGLSVGLLVMTRAVGIACFGGLICIFLFKIIKNRKLSDLKYIFVFLPFVPAAILGYVLYSEKLFFIGYPGSGYIDALNTITSSFSNIFKFLRLFANEINYFILMSYIIFMAFTIFLIINRKKIIDEKREKLGILLVYGFSTIFLLIFITSVHIFSGESTIYSRYVSPGLPIIFILGIIGLDKFLEIKINKKYFQLAFIIVILCFICILLFPFKIISDINNLDLIWIKYLGQIYVYNFSLLQICLIMFMLITIIFSILLVLRWFEQKSLILFEKLLKKPFKILIITLIISLLLSIPSITSEIEYSTSSKSFSNTILAFWFMENVPKTNVILEDIHSAFSGGGIDGENWHYIHVNLHFWLPKEKVDVLNREELSKLILSNNLSTDYLVSTHDLTDYYPKVQEFYMDLDVWPIKKQPYVDWYIYKIK